MNWADAILWGFLATVLQTTIEAAGRGLGVTRMSIPFMLGTIVSPDRDRAVIYGLAIHMINGWLLALLYAVIFESLARSAWWLGAGIGLAHGLFVRVVLMPLLPSFHPRMAADHDGPDPTPMLEPPGFLALNYGWMTTLVSLLAHAAYGGFLGWMYRPAG